MVEIKVTLSDAEFKAMSTQAKSVQEWFEIVAHDRCRIAIDDVVKAEIERKLAAGETISGSKEDIVMAATLETAAERNVRLEAELQASLAARKGA